MWQQPHPHAAVCMAKELGLGRWHETGLAERACLGYTGVELAGGFKSSWGVVALSPPPLRFAGWRSSALHAVVLVAAYTRRRSGWSGVFDQPAPPGLLALPLRQATMHWQSKIACAVRCKGCPTLHRCP